jgi:hypothetical protein
MPDEIRLTPSAAAAFLYVKLVRHGWQFRLDQNNDLQIIFGDDPPRLPQQEAMVQLGRVLEEFKDLLRSSDPDDGGTIH